MSKDYEDLPEWEVTYIDPADGETYSIEVRAKDEAYAEEVAREELTAESPATDTDEWEILAVTRLDAPSLVPTLHLMTRGSPVLQGREEARLRGRL